MSLPSESKIVCGEARAVLRTLPAKSVHCCITSPPYWGLRDYGHAEQIGMEETPAAFVAALVEVFGEVHRVLRDDGTLWLNLGDSYAGSWGAQSREHAGKHAPNPSAISANQVKAAQRKASGTGSLARTPGLKNKDLVGVPWMVAFALRDAGWYLRQDIIWSKPNPMPESVRDRCVKSHEYLFLLSKSPTYYYDLEAVKEPAACAGQRRGGSKNRYEQNAAGMDCKVYDKRNKRSVWPVKPAVFKGAHFATFPPALITPCVLAGSPLGGLVLDPFCGAGTTPLVARAHGRAYMGIELNPEYVEIAEGRLKTCPE